MPVITVCVHSLYSKLMKPTGLQVGGIRAYSLPEKAIHNGLIDCICMCVIDRVYSVISTRVLPSLTVSVYCDTEL